MNRRLSQTALAHGDRCLHSFLLYQRHNGGAPSIPKLRGSLLHACWERLLRNLIEHGEPSLFALGHTQGPKGEAVAEDEASAKRAVASMTEEIVSQVRAEHPELHVPAADVDAVRAMLFHLAVANPVDPARVVAVERKFVLDVGDYVISGKVDVCSLRGEHAEVDDIKSQFWLPGQEEYEDALQHKVYATLVVHGQPVSKQPCPLGCVPNDLGLAMLACPTCGGSGTVEVREPGIGGRVQWVTTRELYPRYLRDDGTLQERSHTLTRTDIADFRVDLEALVARIDLAAREDEWPAVPGHHCLSLCPAPHECPLPVQLRVPRGTEEGLPLDAPEIRSPEDAAREAERWYFLSESATALRKGLRGWSKKSGQSIPIGRDLELSFRKVDKRSVDREAMKAAAGDAARFGHPFDPDAYVDVKSSTEFAKRRLSAEEIKAREAGQEGEAA